MNATICLYGNWDIGFGYIAVLGDKTFGDGEPVKFRSCTDCVWLACEELIAAGFDGLVEIYAAGGERRAVSHVRKVGYFGNLKWERAEPLVIQMVDILAAAEVGNV